MELFLVGSAAFLASGLTFFSGFGLGTLLMPVLAVFFPLPEAVAVTAVVHLLNNLFKFALVGRHVDRRVFLRFTIPAVPFAFLGAWLLQRGAGGDPLGQWTLGGKVFLVEPLALGLGALMVTFAVFDLVPRFKNASVEPKWIPVGGVLSGFFGGLSGHQGALRSVFLLRTGLSKESFIATGVAAACVVDVARLSKYLQGASTLGWAAHGAHLLVATVAAFLGAWLGNRMLKKVTLEWIQTLVALMILVIAVLLGSGVLSSSSR